MEKIIQNTCDALFYHNIIYYIQCWTKVKNSVDIKILCTKRRDYYESLTSKLDTINDSKSWWDVAKEIQGRKFFVSPSIEIENLKAHFESLLCTKSDSSEILYAEPYILNPQLDRPIEMNELTLVISGLKDNKAPGIDRVPYEFFKNSPDIFLVKLLESYNRILEKQIIPQSFTESVIFPAHKKGSTDLVENYRGLLFMDAIAKIFVGILYNRLSSWEREHTILSESQAGFRRGYSTVDSLFNLISIIKLSHYYKKKKIYAFFIDFKAAFDTVVRKSLFYKLHNYGVSHKIMKILQGLYTNTTAKLWDGSNLSDSFATTCGVKQGCVLSPLLFALFINDLEEYLEEGIALENLKIKALLYADDIVMLADEPIKLQRMINGFTEYCKFWSLEVNLSKSKIMIFQRGGGVRNQSENWVYEDKAIEVVKSYKYLGIILTPKLSFTENCKQRLQIAKIGINSTWQHFLRKKGVKHSEKVKLFNAVSRSVLCYAGQVWGFTQYEDVEKLQRFFIKKLLYLPQQTPNYAITLETDLPSLYIFTLKCHFMYILKVLFFYDSSRLPHKLAWITTEKGIYWSEAWYELTQKHNVSINLREDSLRDIKSKQAEILIAEDTWQKLRARERARCTVRHGLYDKLSYTVDQNYFVNENPIKKISLIMQYRCGLINLNASPWRREGSSLCSLCNLSEPEDLLHFLGVCPILAEFRVAVCGKKTFTENEVIDILNGRNQYNDLLQFITKAWKYRALLVAEYNP